MDNLLKHTYYPSICEVLIRFLNHSRIADEKFDHTVINLRKTYVKKLLEKLGSDNGIETHMSVVGILKESVDQQYIYDIIMDNKGTIIEYLKSDN